MKPSVEQFLPQIFLSLLILGLGATFAIWTATSWLEYPRFLAAVILLFALPGFALTLWLDLDLLPIERFTLSVVLGIVTTCSLYAAAAWMGHPDLVWLWALTGIAKSITERKSFCSDLRQIYAGVEKSHLLLPVVIFAGLLPLYVLPFYYANLTSDAQGGMVVGGPKDLLFHLSIAAELTHTFPPQVPFMAGVPLSYHIGMDLVAAVLNRCGGVSIEDSVTRFCPTLFVVISILSAFSLGFRFTGSRPAAAATALLAVLGEDFSFIPGILRSLDVTWASEIFFTPTAVSLYLFNPMAIGHGLLFSSLFCLWRSIESPRMGWAIAAAVCSAALLQTKIFAFVHLAIALCIVETIQIVAFRRFVFLRQGMTILLVSLPVLLPTLLNTGNGNPVIWTWSSGLDTYVDHASRTMQWPLLVSFPLLGLVAFLAGTYGFRILGLVEWAKSFWLAESRPFTFLLGVFVALGPLLTLTSYIGPKNDYSPYNNAVWFMVQSKYLATLFAVVALVGFWKRLGSVGRSLLIVSVATISFASTAQYLTFNLRDSAHKLPAATTEIIHFLNKEARPGQVAISRIDASILAFTKLRVPFSNLYASSFDSPGAIATRIGDMQAFWQSWDRGTVRTDLLRKYHADWVVAVRANESGSHSGISSQVTEGMSGLELVFTNKLYQVYRVRLMQ